MAKSLGISFAKVTSVPKNDVLEKVFRDRRRKPKEDDVAAAASKTGLTKLEVTKWFNQRRKVDQPSVADKFSESFWRFTMYFLFTVYAFVVMWDKEWTFEPRNCWVSICV